MSQTEKHSPQAYILKTPHQLFQESVEMIKLMQETALKWQSLSSDCRETIAVSRDLIAQSTSRGY